MARSRFSSPKRNVVPQATSGEAINRYEDRATSSTSRRIVRFYKGDDRRRMSFTGEGIGDDRLDAALEELQPLSEPQLETGDEEKASAERIRAIGREELDTATKARPRIRSKRRSITTAARNEGGVDPRCLFERSSTHSRRSPHQYS